VPTLPEIPAVEDALFYEQMQEELHRFLEAADRRDLAQGPFFAPSINYGRWPIVPHWDEAFFDGPGQNIVVAAVQGDGVLVFMEEDEENSLVVCVPILEGTIYMFRGTLRTSRTHGVFLPWPGVMGDGRANRVSYTWRVGDCTPAECESMRALWQPTYLTGALEAARPIRFLMDHSGQHVKETTGRIACGKCWAPMTVKTARETGCCQIKLKRS
jgi:hypothetical protein